MKQYLTLKDLAEKLRITTHSAYRMLKENKLPPSYQPSGPRGKILFQESEVESWMEAVRARKKG